MRFGERVHLYSSFTASVDVYEIGESCRGTSEYHQYEKKKELLKHVEGMRCCPVCSSILPLPQQ